MEECGAGELVTCVPGLMRNITLKRVGRDLSSFNCIHRPMSIAMEQCGIVGVNLTSTYGKDDPFFSILCKRMP